MGLTACTVPQCLYSRAIPLLPLWSVRPVQCLSACTSVHLYLYLITNCITIRLQCNSHAFKFPNVFLSLLPLPPQPSVGPHFLFFRFLDSNISYEADSQPHAQTPSRKTTVCLLVWLLPFDLSGILGPTSSYATASNALRFIWPCKPHRYIKIGINLVRSNIFRSCNSFQMDHSTDTAYTTAYINQN
jgi:hypothetical protein